jgi:hypothetical protein
MYYVDVYPCGMIDEPKDILVKAAAARGLKGPDAVVERYGWGEHRSTVRANFYGTRDVSKKMAALYKAAWPEIDVNALLGLPSGEGDTTVVLATEEAELGVWREVGLSEEGTPKSITIPKRAGPLMKRQRAVEVKDGSVNRVIRQGEFAIYVPITEREIEDLEDGYVYVLRRHGYLQERSIRKVAGRKGGKLELTSDSTDSRYASKIAYPSDKPGEKVVILGRVIAYHGKL